ncbi:MAG TPA: hypothetical protein VFI72_08860 [Candidatus Angelobacter sp.]|nr:hypothetical protein [Candidatus Angelobacter sp.]
MSTSDKGRAKFPQIALVIGVLSGLFTIGLCLIYRPLLIVPLIALPFGMATIALVYLKLKKCSGWSIIGLLTLSVAAYSIGVYGSGYVLSLFPGIPRAGTDPGSLIWFTLAGFMGALAMTLSLLLMFAHERIGRILLRSVLGSLWGGLFGFLATAIPIALGIAMPRMRQPSDGTISGNLINPIYLAYLIWQTGMAVVIFRMLPESSLIEGRIDPGATESRRGMPVYAKVLLLIIIVGPLASWVYVGGHDSYQSWQRRRSWRRLIGATPPTANLPQVQTRPAEQVLPWSRIGDFNRTFLGSRVIQAKTANTDEIGPYTLPERVSYSASYRKPGVDADRALLEDVSVAVTEFPNAEWAHYGLKLDPRNFGFSNYEYMDSAKVSEFGGAVMVSPAKSASSGALKRDERFVTIYWPSGDKVVEVNSGDQPCEVAREIVRRYLDKYPSTL